MHHTLDLSQLPVLVLIQNLRNGLDLKSAVTKDLLEFSASFKISARREIDAFSLWAALPHYASGSPSPKATLALIEELDSYFDITIPAGDLPEAAKAWEIAVTQLAEEDSEISEYVKQLEADKDDSDFEETTGEDIAKEFERFLRRQGDTQ